MYKTNFSSDIWNLCPWERVWCPRSNWQFKWVEVKPGLPELGEMSSSYGQFVYVFSWPSAWSTLWVQGEDLCIYTFEAKTQHHVYHTNIAVVLRASVKILANVFLSPSQTNVKSLCQVFFLLWHCMVIDLCWLYVSEKQSYHANALPWVVVRKGTPSLQWTYNIACSTTVTKYCHLSLSFSATFIMPTFLSHSDLVSSISDIIFKK